ncbi:phosphoglycolate phosphatase [Sporobacter termitidis DSM 10068]|uniref:Phosphoglycolate phosphatase n=1 Tax=Sporobacter termitidis DSM 10068 TaxID=1123282 RepID=A0A1M5XS75_9FIRM|nr:HAD hydrolase-like protein [Sporobacter termitidis]SHI02599.1 phosphoglycolate phosphatase [Sporobacter termitidis DSM 10068]
MTNLLFDFDGTLHDTLRIYAPAFRAAYTYLTGKGLAAPRAFRDEALGAWLGYSSRDMWNTFMPGLPDAEKGHCSRLIGAEMLSALRAGKGRLYDGAEDALRALKSDGYNLIFLSNCKLSYMQESIRQFSLAQYFTSFYCTEQYDFAPKHEIFRDIAGINAGDFIAIGDRLFDIQLARQNGFPSIGCRYGYGQADELADADAAVDSPRDIAAAVRRLSAEA